MRDVEKTFWPLTGPIMDAGPVEIKIMSTDRSRRCYSHSLCALCFSFLSQTFCSWMSIVLKKLCFIFVAVISSAEWLVRGNAEIEGLQVVFRLL